MLAVVLAEYGVGSPQYVSDGPTCRLSRTCRGDPKYSGFQNSVDCAGVVVETSNSSLIMGNSQAVFAGPEVEIEMNSRKCSSTKLPR